MKHKNDDRPDARVKASARSSLLARFIGNKKGTTAIEFTALAIPFALLVFAILESCISFAAQQLLANATDEVARQIRTGQLKTADATKQEVHDRICAKLKILVGDGCPYLYFDLEQYDTFADAAKVRTKLTADRDLDTSTFKSDPGPALSKNMLRVFYEWPVMTDFMAKSMSNLNNGRTLLFATVTWQNEPFSD